MYKKWIKRLVDVLFSIIGLFLLFPIILILILFLTLTNKGTPFFIQKRLGKNKKVFKIIKFKTMNDKKDNNGNLLPDEKRLTPIGNFIRTTSLDEIPQLINVIIGTMSLVGPRPLLTHYANLYLPFQDRRHEVLPGITGWSQINGRNALDWNRRFELDVYYVENLSFLLDIKILLKTIIKIFKRENITHNSITIEPFLDSTDLYLYGTGEWCESFINLILSEGKYNIKAIFDDFPKVEKVLEFPVIKMENIELLEDKNIIITIKDNKIRKKKALFFKSNFVTIIHPKATVSKFSTIGKGTQIMENVIVEDKVAIGNHIVINENTSIKKSSVLEDYVYLSSNVILEENVVIGELTKINEGVKILENVIIGKNVIIKSNAIVSKNIPDNSIVEKE